MNEAPIISFLKKPVWIAIPISIWLSFIFFGNLSTAYFVGVLSFLYTLKPFLVEGLYNRAESFKLARTKLGNPPTDKEVLDAGANYLGIQILFTLVGFYFFFIMIIIPSFIFLKKEFKFDIISKQAQKTFETTFLD